MDELTVVKSYMSAALFPKLTEFLSNDEFIVVLGGSHSFGMADEFSDVDIFLIWDVEPQIWGSKLRDILCKPQVIDGCNFQIVPTSVSHKENTAYFALYKSNNGALKYSSINELFNISNYIPIYDVKNKINSAQEVIRNFDDEFWRETCKNAVCTAIDILEALYDASKRQDLSTLFMYFGIAMQKLLELHILANRKFYPQPKWLWKTIKLMHNELYVKYYLSDPSVLNVESMVAYIRNMAEDASKILLKRDLIQSFIADDLINPD